jgi:hypothetical protein
MNGILRVELQEKAGVRPIVEDLNDLYTVFGSEKIVVLTPRAEIRLRSGYLAQIPLQVAYCSEEIKLTLIFERGYPSTKLKYNLDLISDKVDINQYDKVLWNFIKYKADENERCAVSFIKYILSLVDINCDNELSVPPVAPVNEFDDSEYSDVKCIFRCRSCRCLLFDDHELSEHSKKSDVTMCRSYSLETAPEWLNLEIEGKILCPNEICSAKLGSWSWVGSRCSCNDSVWISPSFQFTASKVDKLFLNFGSDEADES